MGLFRKDINISSFTLSPDLQTLSNQTSFLLNWDINWLSSSPNAICTNTVLPDAQLQIIQYPRFLIGREIIQAPQEFHQSIQLTKLLPNQAQFIFQPWPGINFQVDVLVQSPQICISRYGINNSTEEAQQFTFEWFEMIQSSGKVQSLPWKKNNTVGLSIEAEGNFLLCTIVGPTKIGQHSITSMTQSAQIEAGDETEFFVISTYASSLDECAALINQFNLHNWDGYLVRNELSLNAAQIHIQSQNADWDAVFQFSQIQAQRHLFLSSSNEYIENNLQEQHDQSNIAPTSAIQQPQSCSKTLFQLKHQWNTLGRQYPFVFQNQVSQYFESQDNDGNLNWCYPAPATSLAGMAFPIAADLVWQIFEQTEDLEWLSDLFPKLRKYLLSWFSEVNDKDQDGCPEWQNPYQAGIEDAILYQQYPFLLHPYIFSQFEHPGLIALLANELNILSKIANILSNLDEAMLWRQKSELMWQHLNLFWNKKELSYQTLDYFTHTNLKSQKLGHGLGEQKIEENISLDNPVRIRLDLSLDGAYTRPVRMILHGKSGPVSIKETVNYTSIIWMPDQASLISSYTYTQIEQIEVIGLKPEESWTIQTLYYPYHDISMLLPHLYERQLSKKSHESLSLPAMKNHLCKYGLSTMYCELQATPKQRIASIAWNGLLIEKMLDLGDLDSAVELFKKITAASVQQLRDTQSLFSYFDCQTANGYGDKNSPLGLLPNNLLLNLLGIKKLSTNGINITHFNPFTSIFTVQYKGIRLVLRADSVEVFFRGFITRITEPGNHRISFSTNVVK
ncbi:MAG: hypothetical protein JEZ00_03705 [Anaerolineaceae bacterium]|nr:hypothetical protein [Anaerolineaceae bacterium]